MDIFILHRWFSLERRSKSPNKKPCYFLIQATIWSQMGQKRQRNWKSCQTCRTSHQRLACRNRGRHRKKPARIFDIAQLGGPSGVYFLSPPPSSRSLSIHPFIPFIHSFIHSFIYSSNLFSTLQLVNLDRSDDKVQSEMENAEIPVESYDFDGKPYMQSFRIQKKSFGLKLSRGKRPVVFARVCKCHRVGRQRGSRCFKDKEERSKTCPSCSL